jgi:PAS domain S-box-containing protein/putative nucleotidyltransferase with HDIG domain
LGHFDIRELLDFVSEAVAVFSRPEGRFIEANAIFLSRLGYSREELSGIKLSDLIIAPDFNKLAPVLSLDASVEDMSRAMLTLKNRGGEEVESKADLVPCSHLGKEAILYLFLPEDSRPAESLVRAVRAWSSIAKEEKRATCILSKKGELFDVNRLTLSLLGYSRREELVGRHFTDLFLSEEEGQSFLARLGKEGELSDKLVSLRSVSGESIKVRISAFGLLGVKKELVGYAAVIIPLSQGFKEDKIKKEKIGRIAEGVVLSEEKFKEIFDNASDIIFMVDREGRFIYVNKAATKAVGYPLDKFIGNKFDFAIFPEDLPKARAKFRHTLKGSSHSYEIRIKRRDGSIGYLEISSNPIIENGEVVGSQGIARDITERRIFGQRLKTQSRIINTMFDAVVSVDLEDKIIFWNEGAERIFGYREDEIIGERLTVLVPDDQHKLEMKTIFDEVRKAGYYPYLETVRRRKDGKLIDVALTIIAIYDEEKRLIGVTSVLKDISERKRIERRLKWIERVYREIVENASDVIVTLDINGNLSLVNSLFTEMTGISLNEARGKHFSEFIYRKDISRALLLFKHIINKGISGQFDFRVIDKNNNMRYASGSFNPMRIGDNIVGVQGIIRDITEKRSFDERLRDSYRKLVKVLAGFIEIKDIYTEEHSRRIIEDSIYLAERMGLSQEEIKDIEVAAILHDVGKMKIPGRILNKKGELDEQERKVMMEHSRLGAEAVEGIEEFKNASRIIRYHHECYDGTGYPDGLKGKNIPLGARIIAVVDAFDAMCSDRPYRSAISRQDAIGELIKGRGKQFDPKIVDIYVSYLEAEKG